MAVYSVYENIIMKLESVYLQLEMEIDREIASLVGGQNRLRRQLQDLKDKIEILNSLKRNFEIYCNKETGLEELRRSIFSTLCEKQVVLRLLQEKELLLNGYLIPLSDKKLPSVIEINKEYKLRKKLQEVELFSGFLSEQDGFEEASDAIEKANAHLDEAIDSGASDVLEKVITEFQNIFEKILHIYNIEPHHLQKFKDFRAQISAQLGRISPFTLQEVDSDAGLSQCYNNIRTQKNIIENEVDKLLYQFSMFENGKKIVLLEIKKVTGELESIIFKEYAIKQKISELKQQKIDLNNRKENFFKEPTVDTYANAMSQLDQIENRFRRLIMHRNFEKPNLATRFFTITKTAEEAKNMSEVNTSYNKTLFQLLHNNHVSSQDKLTILCLSKQSKLINAQTGKFFFQRVGKTRASQSSEAIIRRLQCSDLH